MPVVLKYCKLCLLLQKATALMGIVRLRVYFVCRSAQALVDLDHAAILAQQKLICVMVVLRDEVCLNLSLHHFKDPLLANCNLDVRLWVVRNGVIEISLHDMSYQSLSYSSAQLVKLFLYLPSSCTGKKFASFTRDSAKRGLSSKRVTEQNTHA